MFRTLVACLLSWLMPSTGRRRATTAPTAVPAPAPVPAAVPTIPPQAPTDDDRAARVRPYFIAWEEAQRQRERRTALVMATYGLDFEGVAA